MSSPHIESEKYYEAFIFDISVKSDKYILIRFNVIGSFSYKPGNSIEIYLDPSICGSENCYRVFSLASSPTEDHLMIVTIDSGSRFKSALKYMKNKIVKITGPWSMNFVLREHVDSILMFSYNIGISPMRSMIKYIDDKNIDNVKIKLIYIDEEKTYLFRDELEDIASRNRNIEIIFTDSIPEHTIVSNIYRELNNPFIYVSGLPKGVREIVKSIRGSGIKISRENIAIESFEGY